MSADANPSDDEWTWETRDADEARFRALSAELAEAVEEALGRWVERSVVTRARQWAGHVSPELHAEAVTAGAAAAADVGQRLRDLFAADLDDQAANPLHVLRNVAVPYPTAVLRDAGMPAMPRDGFAERRFPEDVYDLNPATWADIDESLHEPGLAWSAAKAFVFKARRRLDGFR